MRSSINITSLKEEIKEELASSGSGEWKLFQESTKSHIIYYPEEFKEIKIFASIDSGSFIRKNSLIINTDIFPISKNSSANENHSFNSYFPCVKIGDTINAEELTFKYKIYPNENKIYFDISNSSFVNYLTLQVYYR